MTRHYIPLPWGILIFYRLIKVICKSILSDWRKVSRRDRGVIRWLCLPDHPIRPLDRQIKNFSELEEPIKTGRPVELSYLNSSNEKSHRKIFPKRLFRRKNAIYCYAFDTLGEEYRVFTLDRMSELKIGMGNKGSSPNFGVKNSFGRLT
ncbi:MAG: WYL domain-containing protein [Thermodesulfobacteriota bacterium]